MAYHENEDLTKWVVEYDGSAGWEVVSPILSNEQGLMELHGVCNRLTRLLDSHPFLRVNFRTGLHLTIASRLKTQDRFQAFLNRVQRIEPGLYSMVSPSRLYRFNGRKYLLRMRNGYCRPLRTVSPRRKIDDFIARNENRYYSVNLTRLDENIEKIEIRLHNGTTDFCKIVTFLSLWMQILNRSRNATELRGVRDVYPPVKRWFASDNVDDEDLLKLLEAEGISTCPNLQALIRKRRSDLRESWMKVHPQRVEMWAKAGWYPGSVAFPVAG